MRPGNSGYGRGKSLETSCSFGRTDGRYFCGGGGTGPLEVLPSPTRPSADTEVSDVVMDWISLINIYYHCIYSINFCKILIVLCLYDSFGCV